MATTQGVVPFIFDGTKQIRDLTSYALFRGVTDWANLYQFNQFESGYGLFIVLDIPKVFKELMNVLSLHTFMYLNMNSVV